MQFAQVDSLVACVVESLTGQRACPACAAAHHVPQVEGIGRRHDGGALLPGAGGAAEHVLASEPEGGCAMVQVLERQPVPATAPAATQPTPATAPAATQPTPVTAPAANQTCLSSLHSLSCVPPTTVLRPALGFAAGRRLAQHAGRSGRVPGARCLLCTALEGSWPAFAHLAVNALSSGPWILTAAFFCRACGPASFPGPAAAPAPQVDRVITRGNRNAVTGQEIPGAEPGTEANYLYYDT